MVIAETKPLVTCARDDQKTYLNYTKMGISLILIVRGTDILEASNNPVSSQIHIQI